MSRKTERAKLGGAVKRFGDGLCVDVFCLVLNDSVNLYWVTRQDVAQETEKWAEWAELASAADSARFSVSSVTSCLVSQ